jgi:hypothetical protein
MSLTDRGSRLTIRRQGRVALNIPFYMSTDLYAQLRIVHARAPRPAAGSPSAVSAVSTRGAFSSSSAILGAATTARRRLKVAGTTSEGTPRDLARNATPELVMV